MSKTMRTQKLCGIGLTIAAVACLLFAVFGNNQTVMDRDATGFIFIIPGLFFLLCRKDIFGEYEEDGEEDDGWN